MSEDKQNTSSILEKRKLMMMKKMEVLKSMNIEPVSEKLVAIKKEKVKRKPIVVDESLRRKSRRLLGLNPEVIETKEIGSEEDENSVPELDKVKIKHVRKENEMIDRTGMEETIVVDGHYRGWVDPEVCKRYGIPESKEELGTKNDHSASEIDKTVPKPKSKKGTSTAKENSRKCFFSNPNSYFYRHVEPNVQQWTGDWEREEILAFYNTAKQFGCGDQWGLFSTYIPHRVGYQCSNFYRQFFLPSGIIVDKQYIITPSGEAVYHPKNKKLIVYSSTNKYNTTM